MKTRAKWLLVVAVSVLPVAWSQEVPVQRRALTANAFDLANQSIKQIVRDAAATQSAPARVAESPRHREADDVVRFVPAARLQKASSPEPRPFPQVRIPRVLSGILGAIVDDLAGVNDSTSYDPWRESRSRDSLAAFRQLAQTPDLYPPSPVQPRL